MRGKYAALGVAAAAAFSGAAIKVASAATCPAGGTSLAALETLGSCTVGDKVFSAFGYSAVNVTPTAAAAVEVFPASGTSKSGLPEFGLSFQANWVASTATSLAPDIAIQFSVATLSGQPLIEDASLHIDGVSGTITDVEDITNTSLAMSDLLTLTVTQASQVVDMPLSTTVKSARALDDIGFGHGSALSRVTKEFSETIPEPSSMALLGVGLSALGLVGVRRRKRR